MSRLALQVLRHIPVQLHTVDWLPPITPALPAPAATPCCCDALSSCVQRKLQRELASIRQKRATAQQKLGVLQQLMGEVQAGQHREAKQAAQQGKLTRQVQEKEASYKAQIEKLGQKLEKNGFSTEVRSVAI